MSSIFDTPLIKLGSQANKIKTKLWGDSVFYIKNLHINFTNICSHKCKFCAFGKEESDENSYFYTIDQIVEKVKKDGKDAKELHIVGGLHPHMKLKYYTEMLSELKANFPEKTLKAFGAVEMDHIAKISGVSLEKVFIEMKKAGLDMMPGGGAEIFSTEVRSRICPEKISGERWLQIMEIAHKSGIITNATMLYGHLENNEQREDHLLKIYKLQEKTKGFNAFIPLTFQPSGTSFSYLKKASGVDSLSVIAVSRIMLDNIPHIKAYWVMLGEKLAQIALKFGADDLDGTIVEENIAFSAGGSTSRAMAESKLRELVESAGLKALERDSFYNPVIQRG